MPTRDTDTLTSAIEDAITDLHAIAGFSPNEVLPKEDQFRCAMYRYFRNAGYVVHAEAGYPHESAAARPECDLRAHRENEDEWWIEIKRAWCVSGWNNKPAEQAATWQADVDKLTRAPERAHRVFVLFGLFGGKGELSKVFERAVQFQPAARVYDSGSRPFTWRDFGIHILRAWAWRFPYAS